MAQKRQTREIRILLDTKGVPGLKKVSKQLGRVSREVKRTANSTEKLRSTFNALAGLSIAGFGIREIVRFSDEIQLLRDRIANFEGSVEGANHRLSQLVQVAGETGAPIGVLATSYNRLALALTDVGVSGEALIDITQALQQSFRIAGSGIGEIRGAVIQLSQGLASGELRGQELRSVLEANAVIGEILAKELGIVRGELIRFSAREGGIQTETVLKALAEGFDELESRASNLTFTLEQTVAVGLNNLQTGILGVMDAINGPEMFKASVTFLAENAIPLLATAIGVLTATQIPLFVKGITAIITQLQILGSLMGLVTAFGVGPLLAALGASVGTFLAVAAAVGGLAFALLDWEGALIVARKGLLLLQEGLFRARSAVFDWLASISILPKGLRAIFAGISADSAKMADEMRETFKALKEDENAREIGRALKTLVSDLENAKIDIDLIDSMETLNLAFRKGAIDAERYDEILRKIEETEIHQKFNKGSINLKEFNEEIKKFNRLDLGEEITKANTAFAATGDIDQFIRKMDEISRLKIQQALIDGKKNLFELRKEMNKIEIQKFTRNFNEGTISLDQYNDRVSNLKIQELNDAFRQGKIAGAEYHQQLIEISNEFRPGSALVVGTEGYLKSTGNLSQNIAKGIQNTFSALEDSLVDFIKTGKANFADFTQAILDDLTRIIVRASIIRPLAQGILGAASGGGGSGGVTTTTQTETGSFSSFAAKGKAFDGQSNIIPFANGGIVNSPTLFEFANGTGLMGEAGPEAILPLQRGPGGELGVRGGGGNVNINIINNSDSEVETRESVNGQGEKTIDFFIQNKVKEGLANGAFDKQFKQQFNLSRKGM